MVVASFLFPILAESLQISIATPSGPEQVVDYRTLFMVPAGLAALGALLLAVGFRPPTRGPTDIVPEGPIVGLDPGAAPQAPLSQGQVA
jgi:hypothetical protein